MFTAAMSVCNAPSKLPVQAAVTPWRRSFATNCETVSVTRRRVGHWEIHTLVSINADAFAAAPDDPAARNADVVAVAAISRAKNRRRFMDQTFA